MFIRRKTLKRMENDADVKEAEIERLREELSELRGIKLYLVAAINTFPGKKIEVSDRVIRDIVRVPMGQWRDEINHQTVFWLGEAV